MNAVPCSAPFLRRMLGRTLTELELTLEVACEVCAHCGSVNLFPGFSRMLAFTVGSAGRPFCVRVSLFQPSRRGTRPTEVQHGDSSSGWMAKRSAVLRSNPQGSRPDDSFNDSNR